MTRKPRREGVRIITVGPGYVRGGLFLVAAAGMMALVWTSQWLLAGMPRQATSSRYEGAVSVAPLPVWEEPVFHVPTDEKLYSLAVNVDWGEEQLEPLLAVLRTEGVRVTFFPTGRWARRHPDWVARFVAEGHEVGNHGMSHQHPKQLSDEALRSLIEDNAALLQGLTGGRAVNLFAPPYGEFDRRIVEVARRSGHTTVMWTVDTVDWQRPAPEVIVQRIVDRVRPGAIVLMHPVAQTVQALRVALPRLRAAGYRGIPVGELLRSGKK